MRLLDGHEVGRVGVDDPLVAAVFVVVAAGLGHGEHELVLVDSVLLVGDLLLVGHDDLLDDDLALALELERHGAGGAQVAAGMGERSAHVGGGAVAVVGQALDSRRRCPPGRSPRR